MARPRKRPTTISDLAKALGVSRKTAGRWRKRRGAPFDKDGQCDVAEVKAWAERYGLWPASRGSGSEVNRALRDDPLAESPTKAPGGDPGAPNEVVNVTQEEAEVLDALVSGDTDRLKGMAQSGRLTRERLRLGLGIGKSRQALADAQRRELENKQTRDELVPMAEARHFWAGQIQIVKDRFASLPGQLAPRLVGKTYDEIYQAIDEYLRTLLEQFAVEVPT